VRRRRKLTLPRLERPDGARLPLDLAVIRAALSRSPAMPRSLLRRAAFRAIGGRLPALIASYEDGRRFRVPARDALYAQVFIDGAYEPAETAVAMELLSPGDFAIDVGANVGWFSLAMASSVGAKGQVWAIEPVPPLLRQLHSNLELNPTLPVDVLPFALGRADGQATLHLFAGLVNAHASMSRLGRDDYVEFSAEVKALDGLLGQTSCRPVLIKLDVEGAEFAVIEGASLAVSDSPAIWMIEVNFQTSAAFGYHPADLLQPLRAAGVYAFYRVVEGGRLQAESDPGGAPHGTTWLCVPDRYAARAEHLLSP